MFGGVLFVPLWAAAGQVGVGMPAPDLLEPRTLPLLAVVSALYSLPFAPVGWLGTRALQAVARERHATRH